MYDRISRKENKGTARFEQFRNEKGFVLSRAGSLSSTVTHETSSGLIDMTFLRAKPRQARTQYRKVGAPEKVHRAISDMSRPPAKQFMSKKENLSSTWGRAHFMLHAVQIYRRQGLNENCRLLSKGLEEKAPPNLHST